MSFPSGDQSPERDDPFAGSLKSARGIPPLLATRYSSGRLARKNPVNSTSRPSGDHWGANAPGADAVNSMRSRPVRPLFHRAQLSRNEYTSHSPSGVTSTSVAPASGRMV